MPETHALTEPMASGPALAPAYDCCVLPSVGAAGCSLMGNDYRPDYAKLALLRQQFAGVPILALTATATGAERVMPLRRESRSDLRGIGARWMADSTHFGPPFYLRCCRFRRCCCCTRVRPARAPVGPAPHPFPLGQGCTSAAEIHTAISAHNSAMPYSPTASTGSTSRPVSQPPMDIGC